MSNDDMRQADVANGENPDEANRQPEDGPGPGGRPGDREQSPETESVPTGERQAEQNREVDPPA